MASSQCGRVLALLGVFVTLLACGKAKLVKNYAICEKLDPDPNFDVTTMLGKPWRIQHAWNSPPKKCHEVKFRAPTEILINQVYKNSQPYLDRQPNWTSPQLLVTISKAPTDLLVLFTDYSGGRGNFDGVRYIRRAGEVAYAIYNCDDEAKATMGLLGARTIRKKVAEDIEVPPGNSLVRVVVEGAPAGDVCTKPRQHSLGGTTYAIASSVLTDGGGYLRVCNIGDGPIKWAQGETITRAERCEVITEDGRL